MAFLASSLRPLAVLPSLLDRQGPAHLTSAQTQVDGLVGGFVQRALDWRSLAAMTAGGLAYRAGRLGLAGSGNILKALSVGAGLSAEVSAFELTHRGLSSFRENSKLWRWSGRDGLAQGFLHSFLAFGSLKGAGHWASGENLLSRHLLQDSALVFSQNASAAFGFGFRPSGSLAEQFLHAEATNLQAGAGMALAQGFSPGMQALDRGLDLSIRSRPQRNLRLSGAETAPLQGIPAVAEGPALPPWFAMSRPKDRETQAAAPAPLRSAVKRGGREKEVKKILDETRANAETPEGLAPALEIAHRLAKIYPDLSGVAQGFVDRGVHKFLRSANPSLFLVGAAILGRTFLHRKDPGSLKAPALLLAKRLSPSLPMREGVATVLRGLVAKMTLSDRIDFIEDVFLIHPKRPWDAFEIFRETVPAIPSREDRRTAVEQISRRLSGNTTLQLSERVREILESWVGPPPIPKQQRRSRPSKKK